MADRTKSPETPSQPPDSTDAPRTFRQDVVKLILAIVGYAGWFLITVRGIAVLDDKVFPKLFPSGIFRPQAQAHALLLEAMILLIIGGCLVALFSASRRGLALRILPTLWGLFALTFWLGGGEVAQLDRQGLWRTNARGMADEFIPWEGIKSVQLLPFVWHQRDPQTGLEAKLGIRVVVRPDKGHISRMTVTPDTNLLELANVLDVHHHKITAERPDGLVASLYRFHPQAPQAILLGQYMKPEPAPTPLPSVAPPDPAGYFWLKRHRPHFQ